MDLRVSGKAPQSESEKPLRHKDVLDLKMSPWPGLFLRYFKTYGTPLSDPAPYRRLIGRLLYLTHTRPEISYAVSKLSQFLAAPTDKHMLVGLHVLKYLKTVQAKDSFFNLKNL